MSDAVRLNIEIQETYDVIVVGGGTAGIFAAHAAAKEGAVTLLVEKNGMLGGTMTSAYVNHPGIFNYWGKQIITGPAWDLFMRVYEAGGFKMPKNSPEPKRFTSQQIRIDPFLLAVEAERLCRGVGVKIMMHTMLSYAEDTEEGVTLIFTSKEGMWATRAKKVIDCTGDANLTKMLGYPILTSEEIQPATYVNRLEGYNIDEVDEAEVTAAFNKAIADGYLDEFLFSWKKPYKMLSQGKLDMHLPCANADTSAGKTQVELDSHEVLMRMITTFRKVKGCENLKVSIFAAECGIRETCRIEGEEIMDSSRYLSGYVYDDTISYVYYPIDVHAMTGNRHAYFEKDVVATIPYRALIPKGSKNLLIAGRTVSSDRDTNSAVRVQAPCMVMGTAVGVAAAIAARQNIGVAEVDYRELASSLKKLGATLPEKN